MKKDDMSFSQAVDNVNEAWDSLLRTFLNETLLGKIFVKTMDKIAQWVRRK
ncbi:MAG: hypothetical protein IJL99_04175 [Firmicutes bacterium]|nr:hypothetical protein [Mogibacterium sp.]MBR0127439.1 hypothetical protein [Bacillota bacterium]